MTQFTANLQRFFHSTAGKIISAILIISVAVLSVTSFLIEPDMLQSSISRNIKVEWKQETDERFIAIFESSDTLADGSYTSEAEAVYTFEGSLALVMSDIFSSDEYYFQKVEDHDVNKSGVFTRADLAALVVELLELPTSTDIPNQFNDVAEDDWFYPFVSTLASEGLFTGENSFQPDLPAEKDMIVTWISELYSSKDETEIDSSEITRKELAVLIVESAGITVDMSGDNSFTDISATDWFYPFTTTMITAGLVEPGDLYQPDATVTRSEAAEIFVKAFGLAVEKDEDSDDDEEEEDEEASNENPLEVLARLGIISQQNAELSPRAKITQGELLEWVRAVSANR